MWPWVNLTILWFGLVQFTLVWLDHGNEQRHSFFLCHSDALEVLCDCLQCTCSWSTTFPKQTLSYAPQLFGLCLFQASAVVCNGVYIFLKCSFAVVRSQPKKDGMITSMFLAKTIPLADNHSLLQNPSSSSWPSCLAQSCVGHTPSCGQPIPNERF